MDTQRFMMSFTVQDVQKVLTKLLALCPFKYTQQREGDHVIRVRTSGFCIELNTKDKQVNVFAAHNQVQQHGHLFRDIFV